MIQLRLAGVRLLFALGGLALLQSCNSSRKLTYFQSDKTVDTVALAARFVPTVRPGDILSVQVSSLNAEASALFNPYSTIAADANRSQGQGVASLPSANGYLVDNTGNIRLPMLGKVSLKGMNVSEAADCIQRLLEPYLKEPTVDVRFLNFRISVLGEVARPSLFVVPNEQVTLPEALSMAGDVTIYGRRDNVLVIREVGGKQVFTRIDLTKRDLFRSDLYYLQPNDVIYVEPSKARATSAGNWTQILPSILGGLSLAAIIVSNRY